MTDQIATVVREAGRRAASAAPSFAAADAATIRRALEALSEGLRARADELVAANRADLERAEGALPEATVDRLRLGPDRLDALASSIAVLAAADDAEVTVATHRLADGTRVEERRRPVGVIGANFEARPNVTVDVASQLVKSRNTGVLRTGSAALQSSSALIDLAIAPALSEAGLDPDGIQLLRTPERSAAHELVSHADLIPLVILRGSGDTTAELAATAAGHGVRTLAHAEGGGVLFVHRDADPATALELIEQSLDRLGVCNRLNLLLLDAPIHERFSPQVLDLLERLSIAPSSAPHDHPLGHEWALDAGNEATLTIAGAEGPAQAAEIANRETSGLAAGICTTDEAAAEEFIAAYAGTGAFWNVTTRLLDGFKLLAAPETGINVDHVPGPRGPVTYRDLALRQYVVRG